MYRKKRLCLQGAGSYDEGNLDQETDTADSSRDHVLSEIVHLSLQYIVQY